MSQSVPVVLARKWRPKHFQQVVGQDHVVKALAHALDAKRLHHAYLLTGTRGTGKTTLARIIAKALNCEQGISSNPCGVCSACNQIDGGRFVDYIEIDAASNRGVGEIQQLLEQAQFAPTAGRFKVYVIDEVHMLSKHAFNAMLKTLEEPPPDVKFLLATTDPQQIPVTVLSRCLQFNLKNVPPDTLEQHLKWVLEQEGIEAEPVALSWLAAAAQGSVRDSLSLTDQAIAYGAGRVTESAVQSMLGLVQRELLARLLREIADHQPVAAFTTLEELLSAGGSADALLAEMAKWFHQAAALSTLKIETHEDPTQTVALLAEKMSAELLQLNYQIVVLGRRDLSLAPDERTGLEMTLLRLFAFQPGGSPRASGPQDDRVSMPSSRPNAQPSLRAKPPSSLRAAGEAIHNPVGSPRAPGPRDDAPAAPAAAPAASLTPEQWPTVSRALAVSGLARQFVQQAKLLSFEDAGRSVNCRFRVAIPALTETAVVAKAQDALTSHFRKPCRIEVELGDTDSLTAAAEDADAAAQAQAQAEAKIQSDPVVQSILQDFGGKIVPGSIRATRKGSPS
ncbi:MAG: DNA polymerase III subunit gamma/tau [Burkholderiaceae bacterium]|nr:DNA polymerase III subunit gamma/tau [Burkholderiaceae bacterium]